MVEIKIFPLIGIEIEGIGIINLGEEKAAVEKILGLPTSVYDNRSFYDDYEFRIDYDKSNKIEFIEFTYGPFPEKSKVSIYNIDPFTIGAENLMNLLTDENKGEIDDSEAEFCYAFKETSIGIYRETTQNDVEKMIIEMKENNDYEENKDWVQDDLEKAKNFWTIGIGIKGYYK
ncbi:hypothetical protein [Flavobacterium sp. UBA7680]|uniref:hypothetical protein n=1 Tax=Flavobacterium sp. UBA7680 TaxID=1946559 RepID=UPI0025BB83D8|nr:hypothetical protein [Flavobacterium sp. UBA7680]